MTDVRRQNEPLPTVKSICSSNYHLTFIQVGQQCSWWSIGHLRPLAIALCSWPLWSFRTSWSLAVWALLQCLTSICCEAGLSSSSPAGSRSGLGVWCWMLASWGCVRSSPTSSAVSVWPLVPVLLTPTHLHFGSSPATGFCKCAFRQVLKNVWIFCCIVCGVRHVSHPYNRIGFKLELKMRSLVLIHAAAPRQNLLIKLAISSSHITLTQGQLVFALTL